MEARYRHWRNYGGAGETVFATTTCLDFVHVFREPETRDLMAASLIEDLRRSNCRLHAFAVMTHHLHFLFSLSEGQVAPAIVQRVKSNSARRIKPRLPIEVLRGFDQQRGLNRRTFWKVGYRGIVIESERTFRQKMRYIHQNPVRSKYCQIAEDYRWSSAHAYAQGWLVDSFCLDHGRLIGLYAPNGLPSVSSRPGSQE